jgi:hypothetical protein
VKKSLKEPMKGMVRALQCVMFLYVQPCESYTFVGWDADYVAVMRTQLGNAIGTSDHPGLLEPLASFPGKEQHLWQLLIMSADLATLLHSALV